jgi:hypothetical protein
MAEGERRSNGVTEGDRFGTASRLFVLVKHHTRQTFDLTWAIKNGDYAREVLKLARSVPDAELQQVADRFEQAMFGRVRATPGPAPVSGSAPAPEPDAPPPPRGKYVGPLR